MPELSLLTSQLTLSDTMMRHLFSSGVLIVAILILRRISAGLIRKNIPLAELRHKWLVYSRNGLLLILLLGLLMIWGQELRALALSVVAIAAAIVIATKELILCLTGGLLKASSGAFAIGDRIQIKDFRGDVIDQNLFVTQLLEVGPGKLTHQRTGRLLVLPNALFLSEPVINESLTQRYALHVMTVPFLRKDPWMQAEQAFLQAAQEQVAPYLGAARQQMERMSVHRGLDAPSVEPRVTLHFPEADKVMLVIRLPVPLAQRSAIEQAILHQVFAQLGESAQAASEVQAPVVEQDAEPLPNRPSP